MTELPLDDVERHYFPSHLDRMGVTKLVRRKSTPDSRLAREPLKRAADL